MAVITPVVPIPGAKASPGCWESVPQRSRRRRRPSPTRRYLIPVQRTAPRSITDRTRRSRC